MDPLKISGLDRIGDSEYHESIMGSERAQKLAEWAAGVATKRGAAGTDIGFDESSAQLR